MSFRQLRQRGSLLRVMAVIVVIEPDDIVLSEIFTVLYLDDLERDFTGIFETVFRGNGNVCAFVRMHVIDLVAVRHPRCSGNYDPVLAAVMMALIGQFCTGINDDAFDLEPLPFLQYGIVTPGARRCV